MRGLLITIRSRAACFPRERRSAGTMPTTAWCLIPSQIVLTTSTSEAYSFLFRLLCDPGGEVLGTAAGLPALRLPGHARRCAHQGGAAGVRRRLADRFRRHAARDYGRRPGQSSSCIPITRQGTLPRRGRRRSWRAICRDIEISLIVDEVFLDYGLGADAD